VIIDQRSQQVVCNADRMEIAGEVEIDVLHRQNLSVSATRRSAFYAETRTEAGLTQTNDRFLADMIQRIAQTNRRRCLSFSRCGRRDRGYENQLCIGPPLKPVQVIQGNLCLEMAIQKKIAELYAQLPVCNLSDGQHTRFLRYFDVSFWILVLIVHGMNFDD
jgi:hypothetical protein